ncbi:MAG: efflux RND transporter permease subunit [Xanthomonadaceae bacterium]|nr:efflux RND transporter permease subunit [Xanthomonadaceae bacterium]
MTTAAAQGWFHRHRRSLLFLILVLAVGGIASALRLPVALFPDVAFPRVRVALEAGDQPADQMVVGITRPIEDAIRHVRGVRELRSTTSRGSAEINIGFDWGADMGRALLDVDAAIAQTLPSLPPGVQTEAIRLDPTVFPILAYSLKSGSLSPAQLRDTAEYQLKPLLSGVNGVARVDVQGGAIGEFQVDVDAAKLRAQGLALADVNRAVANAATLQATGRLQDHYKLYLLVADNQPASLASLSAIVLRADARGALRLGDVAQVRMGTAPQWIRATADGQDAVLLLVYQQPDGNSVQVAQAVKQRLAGFETGNGRTLTIANWYDQTQLVLGAAGSVRDAILIGIVLAGLVLFLFLRNPRIILIALIIVPATLAITVLLLGLLKMSFNMMTLGGMAAAVGLLIDDVIVMLEHIMRRVHDGQAAVAQRIAEAAAEFTHPLTGSSAATLVIFLPLAFLGGVTGAFFKALSLTMACALLISYLLTWIAVPLLARGLIDPAHARERPPGRVSQWLTARHAGALQQLLRRPLWLLAFALPLLLLGGFAYLQVGSGFMPEMDEGGFILDYRSRPGTSLEETNRLLLQVERIVRANPHVRSYSRRTGLQLGGGLTEANNGDFFIRLKDGKRPATREVMETIRQQASAQVPGLDIDVAQLMEDLIGDLTEVPQPIEVKLYSDDPAQLLATADKVAAAIGKIDGVVEVRDGINPAGDALTLHTDTAKAALYGLDPAAVAQQVADAVAGNVAAQLPQGPKMVGVRVWLPPSARAQIEQLQQLLLRSGDGRLVPLSTVATLETVQGQPEITRDNLKRMVAVTARIVGRDMGSTVADVKQVLARPGLLPTGMTHALGGLYAQQQTAFHDLSLVLLAAIALVFALLLYLYESIRVALAILAAPLLSLPAVFIGLWVTGIELNISALMGMTMIVGIVTELSIFYFSEMTEARRHASLHAALLHAGQHRMRPILMSTLAAILTLLPLALAIGQGSQMQQPLAVAIIAGLLVAVPLVLLVMPALYAAMQHRHMD